MAAGLAEGRNFVEPSRTAVKGCVCSVLCNNWQ